MLIEQALARIENVLLEVIGKDSAGFKEFKMYTKVLSENLEPLVQSPLPVKLYKASQWALGNFDKGAETFWKAKEYTGNLFKMYKNKKEAIPAHIIKDRLDTELQALNVRYQPIIKALKSTKKSSILFDSLTILDHLYINALKAQSKQSAHAA